jgi:hypothetical protein
LRGARVTSPMTAIPLGFCLRDTEHLSDRSAIVVP